MADQGAQSLRSDGKRELTASGKRSMLNCCTCTHCCGDTPKQYSVSLPIAEFVQWFNESPDADRIQHFESEAIGEHWIEWRYQLESWASEIPAVLLNCNRQFDGVCGWGGEVDPAPLKLQYRYLNSGGFAGEWTDLPGKLEVSISIRGMSLSPYYWKRLLLYVNYYQVPGVVLDAPIKFGHLIQPPTAVVYAWFDDCPMNCMTSRTLKNRASGYGAFEDESKGPPGVARIDSYGGAASTREDCSNDCVEGPLPPDPDCPTEVELIEDCLLCAGGNVVVASGTNTGLSDWDFFFYAEVGSRSNGRPYVDYPYNFTADNIVFSLDCNDDGTWSVRLEGRQGESWPDGLIEASFPGDPVTRCPPAAMTITAANATHWDPLPGVTEVNLSLGCA